MASTIIIWFIPCQVSSKPWRRVKPRGPPASQQDWCQISSKPWRQANLGGDLRSAPISWLSSKPWKTVELEASVTPPISEFSNNVIILACLNWLSNSCALSWRRPFSCSATASRHVMNSVLFDQTVPECMQLKNLERSNPRPCAWNIDVFGVRAWTKWVKKKFGH